MFQWLLVAAAALLRLADAHKMSFGYCSTTTGMENFEKEQFFGNWFIIQTFASINPCMELNFGSDNTYEMKVQQSRKLWGLDALSIPHDTSGYTGFISKVAGNAASSMEVAWPSASMFGSMSFVVVDTDYETYALLYECQEPMPFFRRYSAFILGREPNLDPALLAQVQQKATDAGIDTSAFSSVKQANCIRNPENGFNIDLSFASLDNNKDPNLLGLLDVNQIHTIRTKEELHSVLHIVELNPNSD